MLVSVVLLANRLSLVLPYLLSYLTLLPLAEINRLMRIDGPLWSPAVVVQLRIYGSVYNSARAHTYLN